MRKLIFIISMSILMIGGSIYSMDEETLNKMLIEGAKNGDMALTEQALDLRPNANFQDSNGKTALIYAVINGDEKMVRLLLLSEGAKTYIQDNEGETALTIALIGKKKAIVKILLEYGESLDLPNKIMQEVSSDMSNLIQNEKLLRAAQKNDIAQVQEALKEGADVNWLRNRDDFRDKSALIYAVHNGNIWLVKLLLDSKADVNQCVRKETALGEAISKNRKDIVKLLLQYKADPNIRISLAQYAALTRAIIYKNKDIFKLLLEAGADPDTQDKYKHTPLTDAVERGLEEEVIMLLKAGALLDLRDRYGKTALDIAIEKKNKKLESLIRAEYKRRKEMIKEAIGTNLIPDLSNIVCDYYL